MSGKGVNLAWNDKSGYIGIGLDNGFVTVLKIDPKSPAKYKEHALTKMHKSRVTGLFFDEEEDRLFSIGEDKQLHTYDLKSKTIVNSNNIFFTNFSLSSIICEVNCDESDFRDWSSLHL